MTDFTKSQNHLVYPNGLRGHSDISNPATVLTDDDINQLTWEVVELIKAGGQTPVAFNPNVPNTYNQLKKAVQKLIADSKAEQSQSLTAAINNLATQLGSDLAAAPFEKRVNTTLTIGGSSDYFYPVWFRFPSNAFGTGKINISRQYNWNKGTLHATHVAALLLELEGNSYSRDGDANFLEIKRFMERYNTTCSHVSFKGDSRYKREGAAVQYLPEDTFANHANTFSTVYLRGGDLDYSVSANWDVVLNHALTSTLAFRDENTGSWYVEPLHINDQIKPVPKSNAYS